MTAPASGEDVAETETAQDSGRIRQGDIVRWEHPQPPWAVASVIVTADCDIAQGKHGGTLSYVPILSLDEYWRRLTLPKKIERYLGDKFRRGLFDRIRALQRTNRPEFAETLSEPAISDLLRMAPPLILEILGVHADERAGLTRIIDAYQKATGLHDGLSLHELATILAELRAAQRAGAVADPAAVCDELPATVNDLPGDAFFIGRISDTSATGFVAYLRLVRELNVASVATTPTELRRPDTRVRRIARLRSPFIYRLTQQLAHVFSDIGLPSDYEAQRSRLAQTVRQSLAAPRQERVP